MKRLLIVSLCFFVFSFVSCDQTTITETTTEVSQAEIKQALTDRMALYYEAIAEENLLYSALTIYTYSDNDLPEDIETNTIEDYADVTLNGSIYLDILSNYLYYDFKDFGTELLIRQEEDRLVEYGFFGNVTSIQYIDEVGLDEAMADLYIQGSIVNLEEYITYEWISEDVFTLTLDINDAFEYASAMTNLLVGIEDLGIDDGTMIITITVGDAAVTYEYETSILETSNWEGDVYRDRYIQTKYVQTIERTDSFDYIANDYIEMNTRYVLGVSDETSAYPLHNEDMRYKITYNGYETNYYKVWFEEGYYNICHSNGSISDLSISIFDLEGDSMFLEDIHYYIPEDGYYFFKVRANRETGQTCLVMGISNDYYR